MSLMIGKDKRLTSPLSMKLLTAIAAAIGVAVVRTAFLFGGNKMGMTEIGQLDASWLVIWIMVFVASFIAFWKLALKNLVAIYFIWSLVFLILSIALIIAVDHIYDTGLLMRIGWYYATLLTGFLAGILFAATFKVISIFERTGRI